MKNLGLETILQRVPNLGVKIDSSNYVQILTEGRVVNCGIYSLTVLEAFSQPTSVADVVHKLKPQIQGAQDWIDLTSTILQLYKAGVLQDKRQMEATLKVEPSGYGAAPIHVAMLNDRVRTSSFLSAISEVVRPDDFVVDLGTGTGILAIAAAMAGARQVKAIEASGIGKAAEAMFEANGLADRISLVPGWSTQISLPERADVLITEMIGNEPLSERALEVTIDARKRLLKPDARLIPGRLKVFGLAVTIPRPKLMKNILTAEALPNWESWYGMNFSALADVARRQPQVFYPRPDAARNWQILSEPILLADVDFQTVEHTAIATTTGAIANASGQLDGILLYFELQLSPNTCLSTAPAQVDADNHWHSPVWVFPEPLWLQVGDRFSVTYRYRTAGSQSHVSVCKHC